MVDATPSLFEWTADDLRLDRSGIKIWAIYTAEQMHQHIWEVVVEESQQRGSQYCSRRSLGASTQGKDGLLPATFDLDSTSEPSDRTSKTKVKGIGKQLKDEDLLEVSRRTDREPRLVADDRADHGLLSFAFTASQHLRSREVHSLLRRIVPSSAFQRSFKSALQPCVRRSLFSPFSLPPDQSSFLSTSHREDEQAIVRFPKSLFVIGRGGTGYAAFRSRFSRSSLTFFFGTPAERPLVS